MSRGNYWFSLNKNSGILVLSNCRLHGDDKLDSETDEGNDDDYGRSGRSGS